MGDPACGDGCRHHLGPPACPPGCRRTTRDRPAQHHIQTAPDLAAVRIVADVFFQPVASGQDLARDGSADSHDDVRYGRVRAVARSRSPVPPLRRTPSRGR